MGRPYLWWMLIGMRSSNDPAVDTLLSALDTGQLAQTLLLSGGVDAQEAALSRLVPRLLCERGDLAPCRCRSCQMDWRAHPDVYELLPDGSTIRRDEAQQAVATLKTGPLWSPTKVVVIRPADSLGREAESYLLKHLEEPPAYAVYLLMTAHPDRLLETIKSRCQWWRLTGGEPTSSGEDVFQTLWSSPLTPERVVAAAYAVRQRYRESGRSEWLHAWEALSVVHRQLEANGNAELAAAQLRRAWPSTNRP